MPDLAVPSVGSHIATISDEELQTMTTDDRRAETFLLYSTGWNQAKIARHFGVSQQTVSHDLNIEMRRRRTRAENVEDEIERIAGVVENVMVKAWERHNESAESNINSVAATNYLKIVLEAADRYAVLRGFDAAKSAGPKTDGKTQVIVRIGGQGDQPAIEVGVQHE
jgi:predicted transcriptional regulator